MEFTKKSSKGYRMSVIGLLLLSIFVMTAFIYFIGQGKQFFAPKYSLYMTLPNIEGLFRDTFVAVGGLKVGIIGSMELDVLDNEHIVSVELRINKHYKDKITASSVAHIKSLGVLGDKFIDIKPGRVDEPPLPPGSIIRSTPVRGMDDLLAESESLLGKIEDTMGNIQALMATVLEGNSALGKFLVDEQFGNSMDEMLRRMNLLTERIEAGQGTLGKIVQDTVLYSSLRESTQRIDRLLAHVEQGNGMLGKMIMDENFASTVTSLIQETDAFLQNVQQEGTAARLMEDDELYDELVSLTRSMRTLFIDLQENPKKYVTFKVF